MTSNPTSSETSRAEHDGRTSAFTGRRFGPYRLERRIGAGGMGRVYEARHRGSGARVALKMLLPQLHDEPEIVTSFIDEARIAGELAHPNIVPVYEFGEIEGTYYLTMPFIDGADLRCLLSQRGGPLSPPVAVLVAHQLALALDYIHQDDREIIHRDVTPDNVFITRAGRVLLGDFGVAKAEARLTQTQAGQIKGKLPYLSPEQVRGDPVTQRADVFGLGLLLYEMLTGERANPGRNELEALEWAMNPQVRRPSELVSAAASLDQIVLRALERHPTMRTRDAALLSEQLQRELLEAPHAERELRELMACCPVAGAPAAPAAPQLATVRLRRESRSTEDAAARRVSTADNDEGLEDATVVDAGASVDVQWDALYESPLEWARSLRREDPTVDDIEPPTQLCPAPDDEPEGMPRTSLYPALIDT